MGNRTGSSRATVIQNTGLPVHELLEALIKTKLRLTAFTTGLIIVDFHPNMAHISPLSRLFKNIKVHGLTKLSSLVMMG